MIRWLVILLTAGQCWAGSTNWLAQRPSLTNDYGNIFFNEILPIAVVGKCRIWLPLANPTTGIQYDFSGASRDFIPSNTTWTNSYGGGLSLVATNSMIIRTDLTGISATNNATWFFVFKLNSFGGGGNGRILRQYTGTGSGYFINVNADSNRTTFFNGQAGQFFQSAPNTIFTNQMTRLAWTRSGTTVTAYTGGVQVSSGSIGANLIQDIAPFMIGDGVSAIRSMDGIIYEFLYFSPALSSNEIYMVDESIKRKYFP